MYVYVCRMKTPEVKTLKKADAKSLEIMLWGATLEIWTKQSELVLELSRANVQERTHSKTAQICSRAYIKAKGCKVATTIFGMAGIQLYFHACTS
jgi:hypothetical protein